MLSEHRDAYRILDFQLHCKLVSSTQRSGTRSQKHSALGMVQRSQRSCDGFVSRFYPEKDDKVGKHRDE